MLEMHWLLFSSSSSSSRHISLCVTNRKNKLHILTMRSRQQTAVRSTHPRGHVLHWLTIIRPGGVFTFTSPWFIVASRPQRPYGLLGTGVQDGHPDFHTAPELRERDRQTEKQTEIERERNSSVLLYVHRDHKDY